MKPKLTASARWAAFYRIVARIPRGRVATYAQVALLAGQPRCARHVGFALSALRGASQRLPWQRVMGKRGGPWAGISLRDPMGAAAQRALLEREGVHFDERERVSLDEYGWRRGAPVRRRASPASLPRSRSRTPGSSGRS